MWSKSERTRSYYNAAIKQCSNVLVELREISVSPDSPQTAMVVQIAIDDTNNLMRRLHQLRDITPIK